MSVQNAKARAGGAMPLLVQLGFAAVVGLALIAHAGAVMNYAFTPLAAVVAAFLFARAPASYIGFCMWLWMLTPFVRRVVDWETSYNVLSLVMLAPLLASSLSIWTLVRVGPQLINKTYAPFFAIICVCVYSLLVGFIQAGPAPALYAFLNWVTPVFVGIHILANRQSAETFSRALFGSVSWGMLVIGCYGVWQYFSPQPWDVYWMEASQFTTAGSPFPQQIRVYSTMNSPGPFSLMMMAGLVVLPTEGGIIRWLAAAPGFTAFMLSLVRTAWGGWAVAVGIIILFAPMKRKIVYLAIGGVLLALALPLLAVGPVAEAVQARLDTISSLDDDVSYQERSSFYANFGATAFGAPFGTGLGVTGLASRLSAPDNGLGPYGDFDSGIMDVFFTFGWAGAIVLIATLRIVVAALMAGRQNGAAIASAAVATSMISMLISTDTLVGASGMLLFPFAAMSIARAKRTESPHVAAISRPSRVRKIQLTTGNNPRSGEAIS